jgi:pimeloyl-ACP methyl ester carboxylesterase
VKEYHAFVPFEDDRLAIALTCPAAEPTALIALLTGTGAPRSHRYQLWTRVARHLAEAGLASVRFDYRGIGDSTGELREVVMRQPRLAQGEAIIRFGMRATGVDRIGVVGHCSGSLVALGLAAGMPETAVGVCILPRVLDPTAVNRAVIGARRSALADFVRAHPSLNHMARRVRGRKGRVAEGMAQTVRRAVQHGPLVFLYSEHDTDAYNERARVELDRIKRALPVDVRDRFLVEVLPEGPLAGYESLSIQETMIARVVQDVTTALDRGALQESVPREAGRSA